MSAIGIELDAMTLVALDDDPQQVFVIVVVAGDRAAIDSAREHMEA